MIVVRALIFIVLVSGAVGFGIPYFLLSGAGPGSHIPLGVFRWVGLLLMAAASCAYLACVYDFITAGRGTPAPYDPPRRLVSRRLYRHVRNPMYLSLLALLLGEAIALESRILLAYAAAVAVAVNLFVVLYEEPHLTRRFGATYEAYRRAVPRWIPRWTPAQEPPGGPKQVEGGG
ncbi:MAG: isoprenylcysteine carboxylmethyltransferase family protein [Anaerolineales bacterium]